MAQVCAKLSDGESTEFWNTLMPKVQTFPLESFLSIGFSHHRLILQEGSTVTWATGQNPNDYVVLVYSQDFVNRNFETYGDLKGIFTLSETNIEIQKQIDAKTAERSGVTSEGKSETEARDKKKEELAPLRAGLEEVCWRWKHFRVHIAVRCSSF